MHAEVAWQHADREIQFERNVLCWADQQVVPHTAKWLEVVCDLRDQFLFRIFGACRIDRDQRGVPTPRPAQCRLCALQPGKASSANFTILCLQCRPCFQAASVVLGKGGIVTSGDGTLELTSEGKGRKKLYVFDRLEMGTASGGQRIANAEIDSTNGLLPEDDIRYGLGADIAYLPVTDSIGCAEKSTCV